MSLRLADDVQVRKESWGLLFYQQSGHKVLFIKSGEWLYPEHFDGTWTLESISEDIKRRTGAAPESVGQSLPKLTERLTARKMITNEVR